MRVQIATIRRLTRVSETTELICHTIQAIEGFLQRLGWRLGEAPILLSDSGEIRPFFYCCHSASLAHCPNLPDRRSVYGYRDNTSTSNAAAPNSSAQKIDHEQDRIEAMLADIHFVFRLFAPCQALHPPSTTCWTAFRHEIPRRRCAH